MDLILENLGALHHDITIGFDVNLARAVDRDVFSFDGDGSILLHTDAGASGFNCDGIARVNYQIVGNLE